MPQVSGSSAEVSRLRAPVVIDGRLGETCYQGVPLVSTFAVAGAPSAKPQETRAWLFWEPDRLVFAFDVKDTDIVAVPASVHERDVDGQDRVELFLWSGRPDDVYYCVEIGARGAVHDYSARFYRKFDDAWSPSGRNYAVSPTSSGYTVEGELSREALSKMGFNLKPGERIHAGLFRADFRSNAPIDPTWLCWVDARGAKPDFHVAASFGEIVLKP